MTRPTLQSIVQKLEAIEKEVQELKTEKVGSAVWIVQYQQIKDDIKDVRRDVQNINSYGKWAVTLIGGTMIVAFLTFLINGGLSR
jgi:hypothetical protein